MSDWGSGLVVQYWIDTANGSTSELGRPRPKSGYGVRQAHLKVLSTRIASSLVGRKPSREGFVVARAGL